MPVLDTPNARSRFTLTDEIVPASAPDNASTEMSSTMTRSRAAPPARWRRPAHPPFVASSVVSPGRARRRFVLVGASFVPDRVIRRRPIRVKRNHDRGVMETFAAIVVALAIVALVFLGIIFVLMVIGFIVSFL
jgi:hypothetical protein